jgi:hypothetical protein
MVRVLFKLSMPNRGSWNGGWSGADYNYIKIAKLADKKTKELFGNDQHRSWHHNFGDGWSACVFGKIMAKGEKAGKSDGFCGYDWMVDSIIYRGRIS